MAPKRSRFSSASGEEKKKKKWLTVSEKVVLLDLLKTGKRYSEVAKQYGLNESSVRYIKKDEANIRKTAALSLVRMESAVSVWIHPYKAKALYE